MSVSKKVNYLLRKYDLFVQKYDSSEKHLIFHFENITLLIDIIFLDEKLILEARIRRWRDQYMDAVGGRASEELRGAGPVYIYIYY